MGVGVAGWVPPPPGLGPCRRAAPRPGGGGGGGWPRPRGTTPAPFWLPAGGWGPKWAPPTPMFASVIGARRRARAAGASSVARAPGEVRIRLCVRPCGAVRRVGTP